jgi:hypothetical protein
MKTFFLLLIRRDIFFLLQTMIRMKFLANIYLRPSPLRDPLLLDPPVGALAPLDPLLRLVLPRLL